MALTLRELHDSRDLEQGTSLTYRYVALGSDDQQAIVAKAKTVAPLQALGLYRQTTIRVSPIAPQAYEVEVPYAQRDANGTDPDTLDGNDPPEPPRFYFETGGGTKTVIWGLSQYVIGFSGGAPEFGTAVGVDAEGVPSGVEVVVPQLRFGVRDYVTRPYYSGQLAQRLEDLTGTTNATTFLGLPPESCLFQGAVADDQGGDFVLIDYRFAAARTIKAGTILAADVKSGARRELKATADIPGWRHVEIFYERNADSESFVVKPTIVAAYVTQIYPTAEHNDLPIRQWLLGRA